MAGACVNHTSSESDEWNDEPWTVDCPCGVTYDDGEEMVQCDLCSVWVHTGCCNVPKHPKHLATYVCDKCRRLKSRRARGDGDIDMVGVTVRGGGGDDVVLTVGDSGEDVCGKSGVGGVEDNGTSAYPGRDYSVTCSGGRLADECSGDDDDVCGEFSIEDRVHKHGYPDGEQRALTSGSIVFSLPLWRAVGLVPKAMNFQCNDLPPPVSEDVDIQQMLLRPEPIEKIIERERIRFKMRLQLGKQQLPVNGASVNDGGLQPELARSLKQQQSDERDSVGGQVKQTCVRMDSADQASCLGRGDEVDGGRCTGAERLDEREGESLSRQECENGAILMAVDCTKSDTREVTAVAVPESIRSGVTSSREASFEGERSKSVVADIMGQEGSERGLFFSMEAEVVAGRRNEEALLCDSVHPVPSSRGVGGASSSLVSEQPSSCLYYLNSGVDSRGVGNDDTFHGADKKFVMDAFHDVQRAQDCGAVDEFAASPSSLKVARRAPVGKEYGSLVGRFCFNCSCENTAISSEVADCTADPDRADFRAAVELAVESGGDRDVSCVWLCSACGYLFSKKRGVCPSGICCPQGGGSGDGDSLKSTRGRSRMSCSVCQRWCHTRCAEKKKEKVERASSSSGSSHENVCADCERMTLRLRSLRQVVLSGSNGTFTESNIQAMEDLEELREAVRTAVGRRKGLSSSDEVVMGTDGRSSDRAIEPRRRDVDHEESDDDSSAAVDSGPQKRRRKENHDQTTGHRIGSTRLTNVEAACPVQEEDDSGVGKAGYFSENEALSPRANGDSEIHARLSQEMTEAGSGGLLKAQLRKALSIDSLGNRVEWERSIVSNGDGRMFDPSHDVEGGALGEFLRTTRSASPSSPASISVSSRLFHGGRAEQGEEIDIPNEGVMAARDNTRVEMGEEKLDGELAIDLDGQQLECSRTKVISHNFSADGTCHSTEWGNGGSCNVDAVPSSPLESLAAVAVNGLDGGLQESRSSSPHAVHMVSTTSTVMGDGDVCNERLVSIEEGGEDVVWRQDRSTHGGSVMELAVRSEEVGCGGGMVQHMVGSSHSAFSLREQSPARSDEQDHHIDQQPLRPRHGNMLPEAEEQALNQHRHRRSAQPSVYFAADQDDSRHSADQNLPHHAMRGRIDSMSSGLRSVLSSGGPQRSQSRLTLSARKNGSPTCGLQAGSLSGLLGKTGGEGEFAMPHISSVKQVASGARKSPQLTAVATHKAVAINGTALSKSGSGNFVQGKTSSGGANGFVSRQSSPHPSAKPPLSSSRTKATVSAAKLTVQPSGKSYKSDLPDATRAASTPAVNVTRPCSSNNCSPSHCAGAGNSPSGIAQSNGGSRHVSSQGSNVKVSSAKISLQTSVNGVGSKHCALVTIASSKNGVSTTTKPAPIVGSGKQSHGNSHQSPKHSSLSSGFKSASSNSGRSVKDEGSRKLKGDHGGVARTSIGMKQSVASMPPPPPQHGHKRVAGSTASILTPMNDEEYAKLLHHELNSSPRMPRISRVASTGSLGQQRVSGNGHVQTLTPAKRLPSNQNGNLSGHHHDQQVSRKRPKEENGRDGCGRRTYDNTLDEGGGAGTQVKKGVACNGGVGDCRNEVSKRGADEPESLGDGHDGNGISSFSMVGGGAEKGLPENDGEAGKSEVMGAMMTASPNFEDGLVMSGEFEKSGRPSRSGTGERKTSGEGKPVTLPVVIEEEIQASSCSTLSFEVICSAVSHWANGGPRRRRMSSPSNSEDEGESGCYQRHRGPMEKGVSCHKSQLGANDAGGDERLEDSAHDGERLPVVKDNEHREQDKTPVVKRMEETEVRKGKRKARRRRLLQKDGGATWEADKEAVSNGGGERRYRSRGKDSGQDVESEPPSSSSDEDAVSNYSEDDEEMVGHVKLGARTKRRWHRKHSAVCSDSSPDDEGPCR